MSPGKFLRRPSGGRLLYRSALILLLCLLIGSLWYLGAYLRASHEQAQGMDALNEQVDAHRPSHPPLLDSAAPAEDLTDETGILLEYAPLYRENPDMAGWLSIAGTRINYPVMHTPQEPDKYLYLDFYGEASSWGSLYVREDCDPDTSHNVTIYGHAMKDGSMFAGLSDYRNNAFWQEHRYIRFDTLREHRIYEIFAVFSTTATPGEGFAYHEFIQARDPEEFAAFTDTCRQLSFYDTGIVPGWGSQILCLSTCEYTRTNGRLVVAAVRIR